MNFGGCQPFTVPRFGSFLDWDYPTSFPMGLGVVVKNCRFLMTGVSCRYGTKSTMQDGNSIVTGLGSLKFISAASSIIPVRFDYAGVLKKESPQGSGTLLSVTSPLFSLPAASYMQNAVAYNRMWMGFYKDALVNGAHQCVPASYPAVLDGATGNLDPVSMGLMGDFWAASTPYVAGTIISPTTANGHLYRSSGGTSAGSEPTWPTGVGSTVTDGSITWTEVTPAAASSAVAGNICTGLRYFTVLFKTRTGYYQGFNSAAVFSVNIATPNKQITISNIPTGPSNVIARVIAFGIAADPAGASGNFFYVPANDNTGILETATIIPDNVTTSATFNFDDKYLGQDPGDVSDFYLKQRVPQCIDVFYSPTLDRMIYTTGTDSAHYVSEVTDPETLFGGKSIVQVAENDGDHTVCARETKQGEILSFKNHSVHAIQPVSGTAPATWDSVMKHRSVGACGPRAVAIGEQFAIFADRSGLWKYEVSGGVSAFDMLTNEIRNTWDSINWTYAYKIWVHIDEGNKEIRIGVPLGTSAECNKVLTLNYLTGWDEPVTINMFGKLMASHHARKWSIDDLQATMAVTVDRNLVTSVDSRIDNRQILLASSQADGNVNMIVPGFYADGSAGIDQQFQPAFAQNENLAILMLAGGSFAALGHGILKYKAVTDDPAEIFPWRTQMLKAIQTHFVDGIRGEDQHFSYLFTNGKVAGSWFEWNEAVFWARPKWQAVQG